MRKSLLAAIRNALHRPSVRWFSLRTINTRLILALMLAAAVPLIAVGVVFVSVNSRLARKSMGSNLLTLADVMAANSAAPLAFDDAKAAQETLASLKQNPTIAAACIYRKNGEVFATFSAPD